MNLRGAVSRKRHARGMREVRPLSRLPLEVTVVVFELLWWQMCSHKCNRDVCAMICVSRSWNELVHERSPGSICYRRASDAGLHFCSVHETAASLLWTDICKESRAWGRQSTMPARFHMIASDRFVHTAQDNDAEIVSLVEKRAKTTPFAFQFKNYCCEGKGMRLKIQNMNAWLSLRECVKAGT